MNNDDVQRSWMLIQVIEKISGHPDLRGLFTAATNDLKEISKRCDEKAKAQQSQQTEAAKPKVDEAKIEAKNPSTKLSAQEVEQSKKGPAGDMTAGYSRPHPNAPTIERKL